MTKLLDQAVEAMRHMPPATQDAIAKMVLAIATDGEGELEDIPAEHLAALLEGEAEADRGEFLSDDEVAELFRRLNQ